MDSLFSQAYIFTGILIKRENRCLWKYFRKIEKKLRNN